MNSRELRNIRIELKLTQEQIAAALNTPVSTYRKWERGDRRVPGIIEVALVTVRERELQKLVRF